MDVCDVIRNILRRKTKRAGMLSLWTLFVLALYLRALSVSKIFCKSTGRAFFDKKKNDG